MLDLQVLNKCFLGQHIASPILELKLRIRKKIIETLIGA